MLQRPMSSRLTSARISFGKRRSVPTLPLFSTLPFSLRALAIAALGLLAMIGFPDVSSAETIYLKSGISISVTRTQEKDGQILYWVGDDQYSIGKDAVARIEAGDAPVSKGAFSGSSMSALGVQDLTRRESPNSNGHDKIKIHAPAGPTQNDAYWSGLRRRIMTAEMIDDQRLAEIEIQHNDRTTADAFYLAAIIAMKNGDPVKASGYFEHALHAMPERVDLLQWHALTLAAQGRYPDAALELERANTLKPDSAELLRMLGSARYDADRVGDAITAWKRAQELAPDATTATLLHKAEKEIGVEEKSRSKESRHFTLHYQGDSTSPELQQQILATLESAYQDLSRQLSFEPAENIIVILYTKTEFMDITEAPTWAGALNDGKLRIPIGGIIAVDANLERNLRHELTHSFVHWLSKGRCPTWLNEGLAELMEPRSASMYARQLGPLFLDRKAIPFSVLQHSFTRFSPVQAEMAYAESLSAAEYLRDRYGTYEIRRMLQNIGSGAEPEAALTNSTGMDYSTLANRIGEQMSKQ
jgi:tetratricopeptide (TPR) repeat protein